MNKTKSSFLTTIAIILCVIFALGAVSTLTGFTKDLFNADSSGAGNGPGNVLEGDLIDVEDFPATDIEEDKVYRTTVQLSGSLCANVTFPSEAPISLTMPCNVTAIFNAFIVLGMPVNYREIEVASIQAVTDPIVGFISDESVSLVVYIDASTGIAYSYVRLYDSEEVIQMTAGMLFAELLGSDPLTDAGIIDNLNNIPDECVFYKPGREFPAIGIPNESGETLIYAYDGSEWVVMEKTSKPIYGRVYKGVERIIWGNGQVGRYTYYFRFTENSVEKITVVDTVIGGNSAPSVAYLKYTDSGEITVKGYSTEGAFENILNLIFQFNFNNNVLTIKCDYGEHNFTSTFSFYNEGAFVQGNVTYPTEVLEGGGVDGAFVGGLLFALDVFRTTDLTVMPDDSEWNAIVAEQGWDI